MYKVNEKGKKFLYIIIFLLLGLIDFARHTQEQKVWGPLINCEGILLLVIAASAYRLEEFRCAFSKIWTGFSLALLLLSSLWTEDHILGVYKWTVFTALINVWLIGILAYRVIRKIFVEKTMQVRWNLLIVVTVLMIFFMLLSPYRAIWPLWFLAVFGLFYLTRFEKACFDDLREAMVDGVILCFVVLQVYAYGYRPFDELRYRGAFSNCNITALHYLVTYVAILIKLHFLVMKDSAGKWKIIFGLLAAVLLDFQILTMTRTAWAISAVITVLFGLLVVKRIWNKSWKAVLGRAVALGLSVLLLFPFVFATVRWLPPLRHHPVWYAGEWGEGKVHSFDPPTSEKYTDFDEFMEEILGRLQILSSINNPFVLKAQAAEVDEYRRVPLSGPDTLTMSLRIRLTIYKSYLEDLNWIGHKKSEGNYIIPELDTFVWHPQNVWIQVAYYYGVPAGVLFIVFSLLILGKHIKSVREKRAEYSFIPLLICMVFFIYGLMEVVWIVGQLILFLFLFTLHPQFGESGEGRRARRTP